MSERCYYNQGGIKITNKRAIFRHKTYVLHGITSVSTVEVHPSRVEPILVGLLGFLLVAIGFGVPSWVGFGLGTILLVVSFFWSTLLRRKYAIELCTSAREFQAFVSRDEDEIDAIMRAIEKAIVERD